ncbi:MAG: hypothetical protein HN416_12890 [Nitrospina sp.]|nr:hypothetical protein [Nitrospina sp.]
MLIDKIETLGDYKIRFTLKQPFAPFLAYIASPWVAIVAKENAESGDIAKHPIGTGPFMFKKWAAGSSIELVKNPNYFKKGRPFLDGIKINMILEDSPWLAGLRSKKLDLTYHLEGAFLRNLKRIKRLKTEKWPALGYTGMLFNNTQPPFDNPKVRLAISYAIDRQDVIDSGMLGAGTVTSPLPEALGHGVPVDKLTGYKHNYEKAKQLLKEAGYPNGLKMRLLTANDIGFYMTISQVIQSQLKNAGIEVEIIGKEWGAFLGTLVQAEGYDAFMLDFGPMALDPDVYVYRLWNSKGFWNIGKFADAEVDKLMEQGRVVSDPAERKKIYARLSKRMADIGAAVWLFRSDLTWIKHSWVKSKGDYFHAMGGKFENIWLDR